ncbi:InlB B-repeat-containing protein [bacterium]|nr:InlB B-repeat-containing protein [bacterium]
MKLSYTRNEYTITFHTDSGSQITPLTAKYESPLTQPNNPTKYGYTFKKWNPNFPTEMPLNGDTLQAQRTPKTIHVTLDHQGGTGGTSDFYFSFNTQKYYLDENLTQEFTRIIKPTRTGYEFQDYFSEEIGERFVSYQKTGERIELDTPIEDTYYKIGEDMTLKARRKAKEYTIKFVNTEDGNFFINNYQYDQTFSIPENPFIKTGYTFL